MNLGPSDQLKNIVAHAWRGQNHQVFFAQSLLAFRGFARSYLLKYEFLPNCFATKTVLVYTHPVLEVDLYFT